MQYALAFTPHFVRMLGTRRADDLAILFQFPIHASDAPAPLDVLQAIIDQPRQAHLNGKFANRVNRARHNHGHIQIRRREDADRRFFDTWKSALDC